jgi:hypothetical protein
MNIARKIGPFVAVGSFVAAGACAGGAPQPPTVASATPTTTAPPPDTATATATAAPSASATPDATPTAAVTASAAPTSTMPAYEEQKPPPKEPVKKGKRTMADGRPKGLKPGAFEAYWVWFEGTHWKLRTTTHDAMHRFQGAIVSEDGSISEVRPTRTEYNDRLKSTKDTIGFDFQTKGNEDGFDFDAPEDRCLSFFLLIDGKPHVDRVNIGKGDAHPPHWNFKLCK